MSRDQAAYYRAWYLRNREAVLARRKAQYVPTPKKPKATEAERREKIRAANKAWRAANPEKEKARKAAWRELNREKDLARKRAWARHKYTQTTRGPSLTRHHNQERAMSITDSKTILSKCKPQLATSIARIPTQ